jgi:hypothetical protein
MDHPCPKPSRQLTCLYWIPKMYGSIQPGVQLAHILSQMVPVMVEVQIDSLEYG